MRHSYAFKTLNLLDYYPWKGRLLCVRPQPSIGRYFEPREKDRVPGGMAGEVRREICLIFREGSPT